MLELVKKYWDIISGAITGVALAVMAKFQLQTIQLYYSIIILILVSIGVLRIVRQAVEKQREKKAKNRHSIVDGIVDGQRPVRAIRIAQEPTKDGERLGEILIKILEVTKKNMGKIKTFFDKFKGFMLTIALMMLTAVEFFGGFINDLFGGALTINGIEVLPFATLILTAVVGMLSNGFTKEQCNKIKALFSKASTNELVMAKIKSSIKELSAKQAELNKALSAKQHELLDLEGELEKGSNNLQATQEMFNMIPQLATEDDVVFATSVVTAVNDKIITKKAEIATLEGEIENLTTTLNALKSQL